LGWLLSKMNSYKNSENALFCRMGRKRNRNPIYREVEVLETAAEGKSIAKIDDKVLFIPLTVPGDIVDVQISKKRRNYMEGRVLHYHHLSEKRVEPFCEHFGVCGGCKWQFLSYEDQLKNKEQTAVDALKRIAKVELPNFPPILASPKTTFYRNKLEFTFSNKEWLTQEQVESGQTFDQRNALGFHVPGRFDKVLDIKKCWLQEEPSNAIRNWVKAYALDHQLDFFDLREQKGFLRNLIIRNSRKGDVMVIFSFFREDETERIKLLDAFQNQFPEVNSLQYVINPKKNDSIHDLDIQLYHGDAHITESMKAFESEKELSFIIRPKSFYQTNSFQAEELYKIVGKFASVQPQEIVYDLYTGTGTIALFIAEKAKKVIGIEFVPEAIEDARTNAKQNNILNSRFYAGDMKDIFNEELVIENGHPDVIITDPPRAGMHKNVIEQLLKLEAKRIIYVSCNPATQARDIELLKPQYELAQSQAVDMFPHTHHLENVTLLKLR